MPSSVVGSFPSQVRKMRTGNGESSCFSNIAATNFCTTLCAGIRNGVLGDVEQDMMRLACFRDRACRQARVPFLIRNAPSGWLANQASVTKSLKWTRANKDRLMAKRNVTLQYFDRLAGLEGAHNVLGPSDTLLRTAAVVGELCDDHSCVLRGAPKERPLIT